MEKIQRKRTKRTRKKDKKQELNKEIIGIIVISLGLLSLLSLYNSSTGYIGEIISNRLKELAGFGSYIVPYIILTIGVLLTFNKFWINENKNSISLVILFISFLTLLHINLHSNLSPLTDNITIKESLELSIELGRETTGGGLIGALFSYVFMKLFGIIGSYIIIFTIIIVVILFITNISIINLISKILKFIMNITKSSISGIKDFVFISKKEDTNKEVKIELSNSLDNDIINTKNENVIEKTTKAEIDQKIKILDFTKETDNEKTVETSKTTQPINSKDNNESNDIVDINICKSGDLTSYQLPTTDLLEKREGKASVGEKKEILNNVKKLEDTLKSFGIDAKVIQISKGPAITRYELQPAPGVKVSKIVGLADDIALNLAASDVRIEAPIPGKSAIGIEVPNKDKITVTLREIIESAEFNKIESKLPFALGKDIAGKPIIANIESMPHLLIAGATGSGKSVCINTLITSILFKARPDEVKLLMIDPKVVELSIYNGIPHLLIPVVTDPKKAAGALNWAVQEMTKRYNMFAKNGVRDIFSYNKKAEENEELEKFPQIVVIIDELADLMMVSPGEVEESICRLAQMARAAGIHLIVATQRPSVDVITGTIKANIPSRISFAVSSQADSRTILDMGGAEKLLGKGDMLFYPVGASKPKRIQGAFIGEKEVENIVEFLKKQSDNDYAEEIINDIEKEVNLDSDSEDGLLKEAIELVVDEGQASISMLQRKFRIGYARAARLIDEMEERGVVGGYEGSKPRKVLITKEDLNG